MQFKSYVLALALAVSAVATPVLAKQPTPYCVELVETAAVFHKELKDGRTTVASLKSFIEKTVDPSDEDTKAVLTVLVNFADAYRSKTTAYVKKEVMQSCMKFQ